MAVGTADNAEDHTGGDHADEDWRRGELGPGTFMWGTPSVVDPGGGPHEHDRARRVAVATLPSRPFISGKPGRARLADIYA